MLGVNFNVRWSWTPSWTQSQTLKFRIGLDLHLVVHIFWALQHVFGFMYVLLIISMVPNTN
jgi:hypothetical protein